MQTKAPLIREILATLRAIDADMERVDQFACSKLGIHETDFRCLDILSRGEPVSAGQIATEAGLTTGAVTALLDRLESAGYVARKRDPQDRRRVLVTPTKRATDMVWPLFEGVVSAATAVLQKFSQSELETIARFVRANRSAISSEVEKLTAKRR